MTTAGGCMLAFFRLLKPDVRVDAGHQKGAVSKACGFFILACGTKKGDEADSCGGLFTQL